MNEINKLRCEYCIKNYLKTGTCKGYGKKCLYNPKTKNCGSCAFLIRDLLVTTNGLKVYLNSCRANTDLSPTLQNDCIKYFSINAKADPKIIKELAEEYDRRCSLSYYTLNRPPLNQKEKGNL